jgi:predicted component of type VI protein secretion system|tara:strand:+ start:728 stop:1078 length:351 start_codon:yes stop_codon:yes gene_type:complete
MNVRIGYTVELEEVPNESKRIMKGVMYGLQDDISHLLDIHDFNPYAVVNDIDKFREKLIKYDQQLQDCSDILRGYIEATTSANSPPSEETLTEDIKKSMEDLASLQAAIENREDDE